MSVSNGPKLTLVAGCKGRLASLRVSLPTWLGVLERLGGGKVVVVDYDCPDRSGEYAESLGDPRLSVVRVTDRPSYNPAAARNAGARFALKEEAEPGWIMFIDADVSLSGEFASVVRGLSPGAFYHADQKSTGTVGTFLLHSADARAAWTDAAGEFSPAGGFDETFEGWGWEDVDFYETLRLLGLREATFPHQLLSHLDHPDTERTRFASEKDLKRNALTNMAYACAKSQLQRISGSFLPPERRAWLYEACRNLASRSHEARQPGQLPLELASQLSDGWTFAAHLVFTLTPPPPSRPRRE
jgi:glycosyltransferase involved in cell wall biosynthesis